MIAGGLWSCGPDGGVHELLGKRRGIGGAVPHADGGWVLSGRTVIHRPLPTGSQRELLDAGNGVCGYNDLSTTPEGGLLAGGASIPPARGRGSPAGGSWSSSARAAS